MIRRLLLVLQSISLIPPILSIGVFLSQDHPLTQVPIWTETIMENSNIISEEKIFISSIVLVLISVIPFSLIILSKYIIYGKLYIFKIGEGEENKLRDSSRQDDSKNSNQDSYEPPFPDGF